MTRQAINPSGPAFRSADGSSIFEKFGYAAAVRAGDFLHVSGQIGLNPDGTIPQDDETQIKNAFTRLGAVLEAAESSPADLVELVSYHVGIQKHFAKFVEIKNGFIKAPFPAWTAIEIAGLARPGLVIEIKAVAYRPAQT